jgi:hypothetical protein
VHRQHLLEQTGRGQPKIRPRYVAFQQASVRTQLGAINVVSTGPTNCPEKGYRFSVVTYRSADTTIANASDAPMIGQEQNIKAARHIFMPILCAPARVLEIY